MTRKKSSAQLTIAVTEVIKENSTDIICLANIATLMGTDRFELKEALLVGQKSHTQYKKLNSLRSLVKSVISGNMSRLKQTGKISDAQSKIMIWYDFEEGIEIGSKYEQTAHRLGSPFVDPHDLETIKQYYDTKRS